jgi:hypothetical protein
VGGCGEPHRRLLFYLKRRLPLELAVVPSCDAFELVSNVPAVLLFKPLIPRLTDPIWRR